MTNNNLPSCIVRTLSGSLARHTGQEFTCPEGYHPVVNARSLYQTAHCSFDDYNNCETSFTAGINFLKENLCPVVSGNGAMGILGSFVALGSIAGPIIRWQLDIEMKDPIAFPMLLGMVAGGAVGIPIHLLSSAINYFFSYDSVMNEGLLTGVCSGDSDICL